MKKSLKPIIYLAGLLIIIGFTFVFHYRIDLTSEKRYSVSERTKMLMSSIHDPLEVRVYLDGDLNSGFQRLKRETAEMLDELSVYAGAPVHVTYINPSQAANADDRNRYYTELAQRGLLPTAVYERDNDGKTSQKVIFPWMEITYQNRRRAQVCLLKNVLGNSGDQNLNVSVENLEFEITDGIRRAICSNVEKIAFIEGHGELSEKETFDISTTLSKYYQIDRGKLGTNPAILKDYKAIIIAKPTQPFSETDKYIIDQYIMNGGNVLWLIDGVHIAPEYLSVTGISPAIAYDLNLDDQLFRYGVRVNPGLIQDIQCVSVPMNIAPKGEKPQFEASPWFWSPLLLTSPEHAVTRNISQVRADFASGIDLVGDDKKIKKTLLMASSNNSHIVGTPTTIDLRQMPSAKDKNYFNLAYVPVAVALEGHFESDFANRMVPKGIEGHAPVISESKYARQIVVSDGDIIRNDPTMNSDSTYTPLGFDKYSNQQYGNKDFIQNAVLYLTDDDGWMELRNRTLKLRLLNKDQMSDEKLFWQLLNVVAPVVILLLCGLIYFLIRKKIYTK